MVLFIIRSLDVGGTERQLTNLLTNLKGRDISYKLVILYNQGKYIQELLENHIEIISLYKSGRWDILGFIKRLIAMIRREKPDVIYSLLGTPNILTALIKVASPKIRIVWGIRASNMDWSYYDWLHRLSYEIEKKLSFIPDRIICNSVAGKKHAIANKFPANKIEVIPNGINISILYQNQLAREKLRSDWKIDDNIVLIGLVGRLDPMKDHWTFIKAAAVLAKIRKDVRFLCIGSGPDNYFSKLYSFSRSLGLEDKMLWIKYRSDMAAVYNAMDIACSSSISEGFPNIIGEAMSCGVPCVVTDVGDSAILVNDVGVVVPPKNPPALAEGLHCMIKKIEKHSRELSMKARNRIIENYDIDKMVNQTERVLKDLCPNNN